MRLQLIFLLLILSLETFLLDLYLKFLLRIVVLLKRFLMILMMVQLIQLDLVVSCLAQRHKRKCLLGGIPKCIYLSFSGLDACYYCSNIIVSLFLRFVPSFSLWWQVDQILWHSVQKTYSFFLTKNSPKINISSF